MYTLLEDTTYDKNECGSLVLVKSWFTLLSKDYNSKICTILNKVICNTIFICKYITNRCVLYIITII